MAEDLRTWDAWNKIHQPFELGWWKRALRNGHDGLPGKHQEMAEFIKPHGVIIDIGSGPRPVFTPCIVIEPLAFEYQKIAPKEWWEGVAIFNRPAEQRIEGLRADTIICWNCINHSIGWREILDNMRSYANDGATLALATEFNQPFVGHPGFSREDFMKEIDQRFKVVDQREPFDRMHLALLMEVR